MFCVPEHARLMCIKMCRQPATSGHRVMCALLETPAAAEAKTKMVFKVLWQVFICLSFCHFLDRFFQHNSIQPAKDTVTNLYRCVTDNKLKAKFDYGCGPTLTVTYAILWIVLFAELRQIEYLLSL